MPCRSRLAIPIISDDIVMTRHTGATTGQLARHQTTPFCPRTTSSQAPDIRHLNKKPLAVGDARGASRDAGRTLPTGQLVNPSTLTPVLGGVMAADGSFQAAFPCFAATEAAALRITSITRSGWESMMT